MIAQPRRNPPPSGGGGSQDDPPERKHWPDRVHFVPCPSLLDLRVLDQALSLAR